MKQPGIINLKYISSLADDIRFHQDLNHAKVIEKQVFFDTSSVLDLLLGVHSIIRANQFRRSAFNMHVTLLHAMAYRNWLGEIFTLPTHTDELVNKIQLSKGLLGNHVNNNKEALENELWACIGINRQDLQLFGEDKETILKRFDQLKVDSVDVFKATYLLSNSGLWKHRYRYLREEKIINFYPSADLNISEIAKTEVYYRLKTYLNKHRHNYRSINNYVDVLALCFLDQYLRNFESDTTGELRLPVFFSDQETILEAVEIASERKDEFGRYPFTWISPDGHPHKIVRSANFFIIEGVFNLKKKSPEEGIITKFTEALDDYRRTLENFSNASNRTILNFKDKFQKETLNVVFLEFFDRWRNEYGNEQMLKLISYENYQLLDKEIDNYIVEERKRLKEEFTLDSSRFQLVKKMWDALVNLPRLVNQVFNAELSYNVSKEIDPRFAFKESICAEIQEEVNDIFQAVHRNDHFLLEDAESRLVNYVLGGLYDIRMPEKDRYNELCVALGILWVFENFDLINDICCLIREEYKRGKFGILDTASTDQYPAPSIALIHAASIIQGSSKDQAECVRILNCVQQKHEETSYQVWIGLSYIYFILWNEVVSSYDFHELARVHNKNTPGYAADYLRKAGIHAYNAMTWLEKKRFEQTELDRLKRRQLRYHYALNNYVFYLVIASASEDFLKSRNIAKKLEDAVHTPDYWQVRFGDTLARYYCRFAFLSETETEFDLYLKWSIDYNSHAIKSSQRVREYYINLAKDLEEMRSRGFAKTYKLRYVEGNTMEFPYT